MDTRALLKKVDDICSPAVESLGYELIESEYLNEHGRWILRLYIDSEDGIGLNDCEKVSKVIGSLLDVENVLPGSYNLEISSPGEERPVRREKDFGKFTGRQIRIRTVSKIEGRRNFTGILKGVEGSVVGIEEGGVVVKIPLEKIQKARLTVKNAREEGK